MSVAQVNNIVITRGTDFEATFCIIDPDSSTSSIVGTQIHSAQISKWDGSDNIFIFDYELNTQTAEIILRLPYSITSQLELGRNYYNVNLMKNGKIFRIMEGTAIVYGFPNYIPENNIEYPYFWDVSDSSITASQVAAEIEAGNSNSVNSSSEQNVSVTFNASSKFIWVAIPSTSPIKTIWYNNEFNNGPIGDNQFILSPITQNVNSPSGIFTDVSYRIYISAYSTTTVGTLDFIN